MTVKADDTIFVGTREVVLEELASALKKEMVRLAKQELLLEGDRNVRYETVVRIMDSARLAGISSISLGTSQLSLPN